MEKQGSLALHSQYHGADVWATKRVSASSHCIALICAIIRQVKYQKRRVNKTVNCFHYTLKCRCHAAKYKMIIRTSKQWRRQYINKNLHKQKRSNSSLSRASYGCLLWVFWRKRTVLQRHRVICSCHMWWGIQHAITGSPYLSSSYRAFQSMV